MADITLISTAKSFEGEQKIYSHQSKELSCQMKFSIFLPPNSGVGGKKSPVLYWLSGLTCDETNFIQKSGFQRFAAEKGLIVVCPDTSPRGIEIAGQDDSYDFGSGAGFYVDATAEPWSQHYRMYSYVTKELIELVNANFPVAVGQQSISGHSMGGHGALVCALRNPGLYKSVSAFSPICNPTQCPWGLKAFAGYLGDDQDTWKQYDATELIAKYQGPPLNLFVDQGTADNFLTQKQLLPDRLIDACQAAKIDSNYHAREGYDHSYFYIASFIGEHFEWHNKFLNL